ncbi:thyrotropin-releasing hormone-degrading ectoenzyme-like [Linepithema humile]|uniref:thyrotropin-releasing hormone-degrading ectoenzyme-like n=1 Tax=Linepithema humile TaxID=83485 RepID=UPI00351E1889
MKISMAFRHILLNVGLILILIIILSTVKLTKNETEMNYTYLKPLHYNVKIKFDVFRNVFSAKCNIIIQINRPTKNITMLTSKIFGIAKIDLINNNDNQTINIWKFSFIDQMYIYLDFTQSSVNLLSPGTYILKMIYVSSISDDGDILDLLQIKEKDKILNKVISAKELFPYWEPVFKSTFNISIWHHKNYKFFSTVPIQKQVVDMNNMLWTYFDISPLMSAEHLSIVITTFTNFFAPIKNVKIWYRKGMPVDLLQFAANIVHGVIQYLSKQNIQQILKIDYVVTKDFEYSNVKTSGFILLREEDIIYNNTLHPVRKMEVANFIARETISYWFHDVLLWSKEGFITFLAANILNQSKLYNGMDLFVVQTQQEFLRLDTLPIDSLSFHTPNIFTDHSPRSSLHYIKSSIIWHMLYTLVSDYVFWYGINSCMYIQYNQTNVTNISNLSTIEPFWNVVAPGILNSIRNFTIQDVIWLTEGHYSVLTVTRDYSSNSVLISYIISNSTLLSDIKQYRMYVTYTTKSAMNFKVLNTKTDIWLSSLVSHHYIYKIDNNDWIILNLQQAGYYRVNYDSDNWQKLADYLYKNYTDIHVLNRAQIIDDAFYFLTQGQLKFYLFWNITKFLFEDADYVAWYPMIKAVEYMMCMWPVQNTTAIKKEVTDRFDRLLLNIGYMDKLHFENDFTKFLREEAVKWACLFDAPKCRETATFQLEKHLESSVQDKLLKWEEWIYCKGLMAANFTTWDKVWNRWNATSYNTILEYLTCSTDTEIIQNYLGLIREQDFGIRVSNSEKIAIYLLIVAKHAKSDAMLNVIFKFLMFKMKGEAVKQIATLIVIITHQPDEKQFRKIHEFVQYHLPIHEKQFSFIVGAVKQKIGKRKVEQHRPMRNYGLLKI